MNLPIQKLILLHAIRGFAALYVVITHSKFPLWSGGRAYLAANPIETWSWWEYPLFAIDMATSSGTAFVILFFVLSGFFIAYSFDKNHWKLSQFFLNRFIRIYTPFLGSIIFAVGILYFVNYYNPDLYIINTDLEYVQKLQSAWNTLSINSWLKAIIFLPHNGSYLGYNFPYWSLFHEGLFYIISPLVVVYYRQFLYITLILLFTSFFYEHPSFLYKFAFKYSIYFALGVFTFNLLKEGIKIPMTRLIFWLISAMSLGGVILAGLLGWHELSHIISGLLGVFMIIGFLQLEIKDNFVIRFLKLMGKYSYSLYLFHFPIFILLFAILNKYTGSTIYYSRVYYWMGVVIAVILAILMYYLVEEKSIRLISKLKTHRKK